MLRLRRLIGSSSVAFRGMNVRGVHEGAGKKPFYERVMERVFPWVKRKAMFSAAITVVGAGATAYMGYRFLPDGTFKWREKPLGLINIFQDGGRKEWKTKTAKLLETSTFERPKLVDEITKILYPTKCSQYAIIAGAQGTGKSTAVMRAIMAKGGSKEAPNGAVYYQVENAEGPKAVLKPLARHVGIVEDPLNPQDAVTIRFFGKSQDEDVDRSHLFMRFKEELRECARQFEETHHRPITVVIDGCEIIAKDDPKLLKLLQGFARQCANDKNIRFVFVATDYHVVTKMLSNSDGSRAEDVYEVGDITDEEAIAFLKSRIQKENAEKKNGLSDDEIDKIANIIVTKYTGGRFLLLSDVEWKVEGKTVDEVVKEWIDQEFNVVKQVLRDLDLSPSHDAFKRILEAGKAGVEYVDLRSLGLSKDQINDLTTANILSIHNQFDYTFNFRYHVTVFSNIFKTAQK